MNRYRNDIDGLRAIAVLLVVFYHCGFSSIIHGGFIGVDVFFVISGFLITKIIQEEAHADTFSILQFYERRIRRIFPAIFVVYLFSLVASFFIMMPSETAQQAKNALSSMAFVSNIYFYSLSDYFDATSEFNALLHTWSLSVEEQFYIFFPPIFVWVYGRSRTLIKPLIAITAIFTLILSQWRMQADPSAAFYMVQYRAWELLAGSALAVGIIPMPSNKYVSNIGSMTGLLLIGASAWFLDKTSHFPGISALPSVIGATLIIWAGSNQNTLVGWALGLKPARFFGWISYSLYLWHWPTWVIANQIHEVKTPIEKLLFLGMIVAISTLSWWFVERPFRRNSLGIPSVNVIFRGVFLIASSAVVAIVAPFAASTFWRVPPHVEKVAQFISYRADQNFRVGTCFLTSEYNKLEMFDSATCLKVLSDKPNFLLMGDSHAAHFYAGLADLAEINVLQATASGCRPIDGTTGELRCTSLMKIVIDEFLPKNPIDTVIISALWFDKDADALVREIKRIQPFAKHVVVFGPIAGYDQALPRVLARALYANDPGLVNVHRLPDRKAVDGIIRDATISAGAEYVSIYDALCPADECTLWTSDNNPIQSDYGHLTSEGSKEIVRRIKKIIMH